VRAFDAAPRDEYLVYVTRSYPVRERRCLTVHGKVPPPPHPTPPPGCLVDDGPLRGAVGWSLFSPIFLSPQPSIHCHRTFFGSYPHFGPNLPTLCFPASTKTAGRPHLAQPGEPSPSLQHVATRTAGTIREHE